MHLTKTAAYLMKSHISHPVIILFVCCYSMRQKKPATSEKCFIIRQLWLCLRCLVVGTLIHTQKNNNKKTQKLCITYMFLPEAFKILPLDGSTTKMADCWIGPRDLCWYLAWLLKELENKKQTKKKKTWMSFCIFIKTMCGDFSRRQMQQKVFLFNK